MGPGSSAAGPLLLQQAATLLEHRPRSLAELSTALTLDDPQTAVLLAHLTSLSLCEEVPTNSAQAAPQPPRRFRLRRGVTARALAGSPSHPHATLSSPKPLASRRMQPGYMPAGMQGMVAMPYSTFPYGQQPVMYQQAYVMPQPGGGTYAQPQSPGGRGGQMMLVQQAPYGVQHAAFPMQQQGYGYYAQGGVAATPAGAGHPSRSAPGVGWGGVAIGQGESQPSLPAGAGARQPPRPRQWQQPPPARAAEQRRQPPRERGQLRGQEQPAAAAQGLPAPQQVVQGAVPAGAQREAAPEGPPSPLSNGSSHGTSNASGGRADHLHPTSGRVQGVGSAGLAANASSSDAVVALPHLGSPRNGGGGDCSSSGAASRQGRTGASSAGSEQQACAFFLKTGTCAWGERCKFKHPWELAPHVEFNSLGLPLRPGEPECAFYMKNMRCAFGHTCKYHHPEMAATMPMHTLQFMAFQGSGPPTNIGSTTTPGARPPFAMAPASGGFPMMPRVAAGSAIMPQPIAVPGLPPMQPAPRASSGGASPAPPPGQDSRGRLSPAEQPALQYAGLRTARPESTPPAADRPAAGEGSSSAS